MQQNDDLTATDYDKEENDVHIYEPALNSLSTNLELPQKHDSSNNISNERINKTSKPHLLPKNTLLPIKIDSKSKKSLILHPYQAPTLSMNTSTTHLDITHTPASSNPQPRIPFTLKILTSKPKIGNLWTNPIDVNSEVTKIMQQPTFQLRQQKLSQLYTKIDFFSRPPQAAKPQMPR